MPYLAHIALVVRDYDEALAFYVGKLGFELVEDTYQPEQDKRWITIRPPGAPANATNILLARAATDRQAQYIGDQTGGRVAFFLATDDFARDHARFTAAGVEWVRLRCSTAPRRPTLRPRRGVRRSLRYLVQYAPGHDAASQAQ